MENNFKNGDIVKINWMTQVNICILDKIAEKYGKTHVYIYTEIDLKDEDTLQLSANRSSGGLPAKSAATVFLC